jgi:hypothetical protein
MEGVGEEEEGIVASIVGHVCGGCGSGVAHGARAAPAPTPALAKSGRWWVGFGESYRGQGTGRATLKNPLAAAIR